MLTAFHHIGSIIYKQLIIFINGVPLDFGSLNLQNSFDNVYKNTGTHEIMFVIK